MHQNEDPEGLKKKVGSHIQNLWSKVQSIPIDHRVVIQSTNLFIFWEIEQIVLKYFGCIYAKVTVGGEDRISQTVRQVCLWDMGLINGACRGSGLGQECL